MFLLERYELRAVRDKALPFMIFFTVLALYELPAMVILYLANIDKPVYLGSLRNYIPSEFKMARFAVFIIFLATEILGTAATVFNCLLYGMMFVLIPQSARFWLKELM